MFWLTVPGYSPAQGGCHTDSQEQREVSTQVPLDCLFSAGVLYPDTIQEAPAREWCYPQWDKSFCLDKVKTSSQR